MQVKSHGTLNGIYSTNVELSPLPPLPQTMLNYVRFVKAPWQLLTFTNIVRGGRGGSVCSPELAKSGHFKYIWV